MADDDALPWLGAVELRRRFAARELSPVELVEAILRRAERVDPLLNALVTPTPELALAQARVAQELYARGRGEEGGALLGIPLTVKDNIRTQGVRTTSGSLLTRDVVPEADAPSAERARGAGAILLGKTNTPEHGWKMETSNRVFGTTRNPWDPTRTPGGSSGGAAACVASGIGPLALGTDGAGSIRGPAAYTGLFGFKGTFGLIPSGPNGALETLGHVGLVARHVADAALALTSLAGAHPVDRLSQNGAPRDWLAASEGGVRGLRIAWSDDLGYAVAEPEVVALARAAADALREAGATVEPIAADLPDPHDLCYAFFAASNAAMHRDEWEQVRDAVDPGRIEMIEAGFAMSAADLGVALVERARWSERMVELMRDHDLLLTPTMPSTAFAAGIDHPESVAGVPAPHFRGSPYTYGMNLTGQPAATVPCGLASDGLPVGLQIIGRRHEDALVLRAAAAFEALRPWGRLRPPEPER